MDTRKIVTNQPTRDEFNDLKSEVATIKAAVTETNKGFKLHDRRISQLENLSHSH